MKRTFSKLIATFVLCLCIYMLLIFEKETSITNQEIIGGIIVALVVAFITSPILIKSKAFHFLNPKVIINIIIFIPIYILELIKANVSMAMKDLSLRTDYKSGVVKISTNLKSDYGLAMLANCITLTPGTITIEIVEENNENYLYVHCINIDENIEDSDKELGKSIKGNFEPWINRIFE